MNPLVLVGIVGLVVLAGFGVGLPLSLATDIGLSDQDVCATLDATGDLAVQRLNATGFPRASLDPVEIYELREAGRTQASVRIDWTNETASCVEAGAPATAVVEMGHRSYRLLVAELQRAVQTGRVETHNPLVLFGIWLGTDVHIPTNPAYEDDYEWSVAKWATGTAVGVNDAA